MNNYIFSLSEIFLDVMYALRNTGKINLSPWLLINSLLNNSIYVIYVLLLIYIQIYFYFQLKYINLNEGTKT